MPAPDAQYRVESWWDNRHLIEWFEDRATAILYAKDCIEIGRRDVQITQYRSLGAVEVARDTTENAGE